MLVKFALELEAIGKSTRKEKLQTFLESWIKSGILVHPNLKDEVTKNKISEISRVLDQKPQQLWNYIWSTARKNSTLLRQQTHHNVDTLAWDTIQAYDDLAIYHDEFEVALLEETRATVLGIPEDESEFFGNLEGIRFSDIVLSTKLNKDSTFTIRIGDEREGLYEEKFHALAVHSRDIVIVDRYALEEDHIRGVFWLLDRLMRDSIGCGVTIYSSVGDSNYQRESRLIENEFREFFEQSKGGINIKVLLFAGDVFNTYAHDRHIRFNNHVFHIGRGLYVFGREQNDRETECSLEVLKDKRQEKERNLEDHSHRLIHTFVLSP